MESQFDYFFKKVQQQTVKLAAPRQVTPMSEDADSPLSGATEKKTSPELSKAAPAFKSLKETLRATLIKQSLFKRQNQTVKE